ncbi:transcription termination factor 2-like isoform X2 [Sipha flava]|nr:transcription termination factor 2-like isoform X2 [Sipha flava]
MVNCEREKPHGGIIATDTSFVNDKLAIIMGLFFKSKPHYLDETMPDEDIDSDGNTLEKGCTLILCCKSSWSQWVRCIKNTISSDVLNVCIHYGKHRDVSFENLSQRDIVITTVGIARLGFGQKNKNPLFNIKWDRIILDDSNCTHYDYKLQTSRAICQLKGVCHWAFIGSNNIDDIDVKYTFSLIKFINYERFYNFEIWKKWLENNPTVLMKDMFSYIVYSEKMC